MSSGYLYCFSNPSLPGIYKIGMTERTPEERLKEANNFSFVCYPFQIEFYKYVDNVYHNEQMVHRRLGNYRINNKEFFKVDLDIVREIFDSFNQIKSSNIIEERIKLLNLDVRDIEENKEVIDFLSNDKNFSLKTKNIFSSIISITLKEREEFIADKYLKWLSNIKLVGDNHYKIDWDDFKWLLIDMIRMRFELLLEVPEFKGVESEYFNDEKKEIIYDKDTLRSFYIVNYNGSDIDLTYHIPKCIKPFFNKELSTYTETFKAYVCFMKKIYGEELYVFAKNGKFKKNNVCIPKIFLSPYKLSRLISLALLHKSNNIDIEFENINIPVLKRFCEYIDNPHIFENENKNIMFADYWIVNKNRKLNNLDEYKTFKDIYKKFITNDLDIINKFHFPCYPLSKFVIFYMNELDKYFYINQKIYFVQYGDEYAIYQGNNIFSFKNCLLSLPETYKKYKNIEDDTNIYFYCMYSEDYDFAIIESNINI